MNSDTFVKPVGEQTAKQNITVKEIEIPEESAEKTSGSKLLFSSLDLDEWYANTSSDTTASVLANSSQYLILQFSSTVAVKDLDDGREFTVSEQHSVDEISLKNVFAGIKFAIPHTSQYMKFSWSLLHKAKTSNRFSLEFLLGLQKNRIWNF